jgi:DNA-directed RNA polymerase beta subunit/intein/homing endonuclease
MISNKETTFEAEMNPTTTQQFDINGEQYIETPWNIINSYFKGQDLERFVRHQLESYNNFIGYQIFKTIEMFNPIRIVSEQDFDAVSKKYSLEIVITFENFHIYRPQIHENNGAIKLMFPQEARLRNFTYASSTTIDINIKYIVRNGPNLENTQTFYKTIPKIHIGKIPIMLKSNICVLNQYKHFENTQTGECKFDAGGYFIINGSEKTVLGQERAAENRVYVFNVSKNDTKYKWKAEIKSVPDFKCISPKQINMMISSKDNGFGNAIYVDLPRVKQPIPLFVVFRALNVITDKNICEKILLDINDVKNKQMLIALQASIIDANKFINQEECIKYITSFVMYTPINMDKETGAKKKLDFALEILHNDLFPHCHTMEQKIYFLGYMANKLLLASFEIIKQDDRDSYLNKRVDLTGSLLNNLYRNYFNKLVKDMEKQVIREINNGSWKSTDDYENIINLTNIYKIIKSTTIENGIKRALSTGDFGIKHTNSNKVGVAQVLNRLNYVSSLSHARRISTPTDKSGKLIPPRKLHNTCWGFLCPAECFDPETQILMWDGTSKRAGDIIVGDVLVDDLGNPTNVRTTCSGFKNMYDVIPDKDNFMQHRVTDNHILSLKIRGHKSIRKSNRKDRKYTHIVEFLNREEIRFQEKYFNSLKEAEEFVNTFNDDNTLDITIEEYLKLNKRTQDKLVLFKTEGIHWAKKDVEMNPYLLGMWLGDGLSDGSGFALNYKTDDETLAYWENWAQENGALITRGKRYNFSIVSKKNKEASASGLCNRVEEAPLKKYLRKYNLLNNKHIPNEYLTNDRETRLKVLAGLIDTDGSVRANGHEVRICQGPANYKIIEDAYALAMSLGFSCGVKEGTSQWTDEKSGIKKFSTYKELTITGEKIYEIPTLLPRKKLVPMKNKTLLLRSKSFMCSKFNLVEAGIGPYVGWQLHDKRGRFCLKDGLAVHNTPEGQSVGVVKNLSYMTHITIYSNSLSLYEYVMPNIIHIDNNSLSAEDLYQKIKVFINGAWVGITDSPQELYVMLKEKKYKGIINIYTSIVFDYKMREIRICNDSGRLTRPLLRVKDKNILITNDIIQKLNQSDLNWDHLFTSSSIEDSVLEYIDPEEQSWSMIATKPKDIIANSDNIYKYTHCEIHPSTIFGVLASCIPFPEHNQSPRNTYQCLDINENVLLSNGSRIPIKHVKIGDEVVCFNPETMETSYTKVANQYIRETSKKIYSLTTISGKNIIATEDHKFMTTEGWVEVQNMTINETLIGIMPFQNSLNNDTDIKEEIVLLTEDIFRNIFIGYGFNLDQINKHIISLTKFGLLPLKNNNYKLPIIARIFGFLLADGSINIYERSGKYAACSFDFGTKNDVISFENDLEMCGFNKCKYNKNSRECNSVIHTTYSVTHNGVLATLLIALGITYGKKTETERKEIPEWIMNGNKLVKREFLSGFQGGDGCKIRWNKIDKGYNFICAETSQQINPKFLNSLENYMNQCICLFKEFDIEIMANKSKQVEHNRIKVSYKISDKHSNLIKYFDNIGYRYAFTKNIESFKIVEYLRYKSILCEKHIKQVEKIRELHLSGKSTTFIANEFNVKTSYISDIIRSYKNNRKISMRNIGKDNIEEWNNNVIIINGMLFMPIKNIIQVENRLISDITVESENHSFIAGNNFLSSNCAQGKQAMGVYVTNYENRMDKTAYVLNYPMRPLVDTRIMNIIQLNKIPSGTQVIVAIMTHTGYNQEDSLLINQGSIDRGMALVTVYHTEKDEDKQKINGDEEIRCKPESSKTKGMKMGNYNKVNSKGVIPENTLVENRDIIISKVTPIKENRNDHTKVIKYEDQSKMHKTVEETYIDKNYIDRNGEGYNFAKIRIRATRKPVIGDKFSSRHGQKGTVGNIIPECDMPFTSNGIKPDIIINPHAIPSRMTIGQLKETVLGKVLVELGLFGDGTAFGEFDVKDICNELLKVGYEANGNELLYNGLTGEQHECSVFMGPVFYQRLKHMVNDKAHSRSIGPMVNLTRQPAEGRSRDGGLRFGEMERDCISYHAPIPLSCGLSVKIGTMEDSDHEILGFDEKKNALVNSKQSGFLYKGERECIDVIFQDGRKITCTGEHPLLTNNNEWIKANELIVNKSLIKTGVNYPLIDMQGEINECNGWELKVGTIQLLTNTKSEYLKTLALVRIIGYLIMDGTITFNDKTNVFKGSVNLGHMIDVKSIINDLEMFCDIKQEKFLTRNYYNIRIPHTLLYNIIQLKGILIGRKVVQTSKLPDFILESNCPKPIVREFLAAMFGADGHTCHLGMHRGKRDVLTSISFSKTRIAPQLDSLTQMMNDIKQLFSKFDIHKITIQNFKETTSSKNKSSSDPNKKSFQLTLHLDIEELIPFHDKIGFRYCCHKSQRLEAAVSYKRLRNEVVRQHNWLVAKVDELTKFSELKKENPDKIVPTKKAIEQAVAELQLIEPLIHPYAVPSGHDITDHLIKGTKFGKFTSKGFPNAEEYLNEIGALDWFINDDVNKKMEHDDLDEDLEEQECVQNYGVNRECEGLPTMQLKVIDIRPAGIHPVYDIQVDETHSFLANGVVAHNCMVSHGASRFTRGRMYDASDKYSVHICKKCGLIASYNEKMHIHHCRTCDNRSDFAYVEIPYACKLLFQELNTMNVVPRIMTDR